MFSWDRNLFFDTDRYVHGYQIYGDVLHGGRDDSRDKRRDRLREWECVLNGAIYPYPYDLGDSRRGHRVHRWYGRDLSI